MTERETCKQKFWERGGKKGNIVVSKGESRPTGKVLEK